MIRERKRGLETGPPVGRRPASATFAPYPEIVDPGPKWRVLDSSSRPWLPSVGVTDKEKRIVYTPLRSDGGAVTRHEMAHVLFSPTPAMPRVRFEPLVLHAVEDARVNLALEGADLAIAFDSEYLADIRLRLARDLKHRHHAVFLLRAVACIGTNVLPIAREELEAAPVHLADFAEDWLDRIVERLEHARRRRRQAAAPFKVGLALARALARDLSRRGLLDVPLQAPELACCVSTPSEGEEAAPSGARIPRFLMKTREDRRKVEEKAAAGARPGVMTLREAPMPQGRTLASRGIGRRSRPATEGCQLTSPHRFAVDRKVFRRPIRWRGGTVLVDTSGSMRLSSEDLDALVEASRGAAVVAIYSGHEREGELRIVARGGRRAAPASLEPFGSGNIVDLPALEWLARQPEPRLWISDGGVTGEMDRSSHTIRIACDKIVRQGRIERVESAEEAARRLSGSKTALAVKEAKAGGS